jgi:membrane protein implicated in regulation of membrane protease activity
VLEELLAWYNLVFYLPLALGVLLVIGLALGAAEPSHDLGHDAGGGGGDAHGGADGDAHDAGHDAPGHGGGSHSLLSLLGFGRVPVMILATTMCLVFGGVGVILNTGLTAVVSAPRLMVWGSLAGSTIATLVLTGFLSRLLARLMPSAETDSMSKEDLIGCTGTLVLSADERGGLVQVIRGGDVYQVPCRSSSPLPKGASVLVTDYDAEQKVYGVCPDPTSTTNNTA